MNLVAPQTPEISAQRTFRYACASGPTRVGQRCTSLALTVPLPLLQSSMTDMWGLMTPRFVWLWFFAEKEKTIPQVRRGQQR